MDESERTKVFTRWQPSNKSNLSRVGRLNDEPFMRSDLQLEKHPAETAKTKTLRIGLVLWPDFTLLALGGFIDVLRLAADVGDRSEQVLCSWEVMTHDGSPARASCGISVTPTGALGDPKRFDFVVVVSGLVQGIEHAPAALGQFVTKAAEAGVGIVGICTGGLALARLGLLEGKRCCVSVYHYDDLQTMCPGVIPVCSSLYVEDGSIFTSAGGTSSIDLAIHLVHRCLGRYRAEKVIYLLKIDGIRDADYCPSIRGDTVLQTKDKRVRKALMIMTHSLRGDVSVVDLAKRLGMSERQLERLFHEELGSTPSSVYRQLRLQRGKWLVENTDRSITEIALECGFSDGAHFARQIRTAFSSTPSELRTRHRHELFC